MFDFQVSSSVVSEVSAGLTMVVSLLGLRCIGKLHGMLLHNLEKGKGSRHRDIKRTRLHWQPRNSVKGKKTRITPPKTASCSSQEPKKNLGEGPGRKSPTPTPPPPWKGPQGRLQSYRCGEVDPSHCPGGTSLVPTVLRRIFPISCPQVLVKP